MINVIYAYAYTAIYYNGDYINCPLEATIVFFDLSDNMKLNTVYDNSESAISSVVHKVMNVSIITFNIEKIANHVKMKEFTHYF